MWYSQLPKNPNAIVSALPALLWNFRSLPIDNTPGSSRLSWSQILRTPNSVFMHLQEMRLLQWRWARSLLAKCRRIWPPYKHGFLRESPKEISPGTCTITMMLVSLAPWLAFLCLIGSYDIVWLVMILSRRMKPMQPVSCKFGTENFVNRIYALLAGLLKIVYQRFGNCYLQRGQSGVPCPDMLCTDYFAVLWCLFSQQWFFRVLCTHDSSPYYDIFQNRQMSHWNWMWLRTCTWEI